MSRPEAVPADPEGVRRLHERAGGDYPLYVHPGWEQSFPWLVQGTTGRGEGELDLGLFGEVPTGQAQARWRQLRQAAGLPAAVHARQVHGSGICWHDVLAPGLTIVEGADGHATATPGNLLTVSVADCAPIFLVAPGPRAVALLHGGWRGVAGGILEAGIDLLATRGGCTPGELQLHCGPAICGQCYQVGTEVMQALGFAAAEGDRQWLDLRATIAHRALRAGLDAGGVSLSAHCTRCGGGSFWSHRGGCSQRQLAVAGLRK